MANDDLHGWTEAAQILDTLKEGYEQREEISSELPDGYRAIEVSGGNGYLVEKRTGYKPFWAPIAEFTNDDAQYEWGDELHEEMGDGYRCVVTDDGVRLETFDPHPFSPPDPNAVV